MVQFEKLAGIHERWVASGSPAHNPEVEREYGLGFDVGEEACVICGESWSRKAGSHPVESLLADE